MIAEEVRCAIAQEGLVRAQMDVALAESVMKMETRIGLIADVLAKMESQLEATAKICEALGDLQQQNLLSVLKMIDGLTNVDKDLSDFVGSLKPHFLTLNSRIATLEQKGAK